MAPFPCMRRGQSSVELLMVLVISLTILAALVSFTTTHVAEVERQQSIEIASASLEQLVREINQVYLSGPGKTRDIILPFPKGIDAINSRYENNSIILRVYDTDIARDSLTRLQGTVPTEVGLLRLRLVSNADRVNVSLVTVVSDTGSIYIPMSRDSNESTTLTFTNLSARAANMVYNLSWSHTLVDASVSKSTSSIPKFQRDTLTLDFNATSSSLGNYVGFLHAQSTIGSNVESFSIPINVEVFSPSQTLLTVIPSSVTYHTLGADFNSQTLQLCNAGSTPIKSISFTPSAQPPGSWVAPMTTIAQLDASSCQYVDVNSTVPANTTAGAYAGSLSITDFTGANSQVIPLTANVDTMANYFRWEWDGEVGVGTEASISGILLHNSSSKPVTLSTIAIRHWWDCDVNHSTITSVVLNNGQVFSGNAADGNVMDITDTNIPAQSILHNNSISFSNPISGNNAIYQPVVTFSDGSSYTGDSIGAGCATDTTPPGSPTSFTAESGPYPESTFLEWVFPGDDNQSGTVSAVDIRYATTPITTLAQFSNAIPYAYSDPTGLDLNQIIFPAAGSDGNQLVTDLNVGQTYYFSIMFFDEADNNSGLSNSPSARPNNSFRYGVNDLNIIPFAFSRVSPNDGELDINKFSLHNFTLGSGDRNVYLHVIDDANADNSWYAALGFSAIRLNNVRIWYPTSNTVGLPAGAPNYTANPAAAYLTSLDLLSTVVFPTGYRFDGALVNIPNPSRLYVEMIQGFTDMNITFDQVET